MSNFALNPVLKYLKEPKPESIVGGGKSKESILSKKLSKNIKYIDDFLDRIIKKEENPTFFANKTHLLVEMESTSKAPSYTPKDLFDDDSAKIVAPAYDGFLIELDRNHIIDFQNKVKKANGVSRQVDISRIETIKTFSLEETLRNQNIKTIVDKEKSKGTYSIWLKPFLSELARKELFKEFKFVFEKNQINFGHDEFNLGSSKSSTKQRIENIEQSYIKNRFLSLSISCSPLAVEKLLASNVIYRIEPETPPISAVETPPGSGEEPKTDSIPTNSPTILVVDGGHTAKSYQHLEILPLPPLVTTLNANTNHGNKVISLACQGFEWNKNRSLPHLHCTFISAQAIAKEKAPSGPNIDQTIFYLNKIAEITKEKLGSTPKVWNLSFNFYNNGAPNQVSKLGHAISILARKYNFLPVISVGNTVNGGDNKLLPPSDCEAALSISGREFDSATKSLGLAPKYSLQGPAPSNMRKPDLSWYSDLRAIGGGIVNGTSFSTPLISNLAAHTFNSLKNPTPDLVKALLINNAELEKHCDKLGWGTPYSEDNLPWLCGPGVVKLAWVSKLKSGSSYYWNDISIPPEMIKNDKFVGKVILTAIIKPMTSESAGENYFSSRVETSLTSLHPSKNGEYVYLSGSSAASSISTEVKLRQEVAKWSPVQHSVKEHKRGTGISSLNSARLYARVYTRDIFDDETQEKADDSHEVAFVLTFISNDKSNSMFNSFTEKMKNDIELETNTEVMLKQQN